MALCRIPASIAADENFAIVAEDGWPILSVYRREDGKLQIFFEQMDDGLAIEEAAKIAGENLRRWKVTSLDEEPDEVQIIPGPTGLTFARTRR